VIVEFREFFILCMASMSDAFRMRETSSHESVLVSDMQPPYQHNYIGDFDP
jgi:hypothetical protein